MEHRYSSRKSAKLNIKIYRQDIFIAVGTATNIGGNGLFIEGLLSNIAENQPVEIEFLPSCHATNIRRIKAMVVHRTESGFGVEIEEQPDSIQIKLIADSGKAGL